MHAAKFVGAFIVTMAAPCGAGEATTSSGEAIITGTYLFDFDEGRMVIPIDSADVYWEQITAKERRLVPYSAGRLWNIGVVDPEFVTLEQIKTLLQDTQAIDGSDGMNLLIPGDVFAVRTGRGNYAKVIVTGPLDPRHNHGLHIQWTMYSTGVPFLRGDADDSGSIDINDPTLLINYLFLAGAPPDCLDAADLNADGRLDLTDVICSIAFQFLAGDPPARPFPECGLGSGASALGCASFSACP